MTTCKSDGAESSGQFLRVEKYAITAPHGKAGGNNIFGIAKEAERVPGFCGHVESPRPPILVWGVSPSAAAKLAESWARRKTDTYVDKRTNLTRKRKRRSDKPCAVVGVVSVPDDWVADKRWAEFVIRVLDWLKKKYGEDRLLSLLEHRDERSLHIHFWVVPRQAEEFSSIHPGVKALESVSPKASRAIRKAAYSKAMANLMDQFHTDVAATFGLERTTVKGKRYSREEWLKKKYFDAQRELDVQHRISIAVEEAVRAERLAIQSELEKGRDPFSIQIDVNERLDKPVDDRLPPPTAAPIIEFGRSDDAVAAQKSVPTKNLRAATFSSFKGPAAPQWIRPRGG